MMTDDNGATGISFRELWVRIFRLVIRDCFRGRGTGWE